MTNFRQNIFQGGRAVNHCHSHLQRFAQRAMHWFRFQQFPKFGPHLMNQKRRFYVESLKQGRIQAVTPHRKTQSRTKPMGKYSEQSSSLTKAILLLFRIFTIPTGSLLVCYQS